ncbi:ATP-binding protein [Desulfococcus sp.]|uniref:hybrid sensor histidine kinase/response regulator n=1 Tax=Desulfococcus sp. TaxID=2025834 RepID=UPI003D0F4D23
MGNHPRAYITVRVPVLRQGRVVHTLVAVIHAQLLENIIVASTDTREWDVVVVGPGDAIIASSIPALGLKASLSPSALRREIQRFSPARRRYASPVPIPSTNWHILVLARTEDLEKPFLTKRTTVYLGASAAALLTIFLVWSLSAALSARRETAVLKQEVDKRMRTQAALEESEARFRLLVESSPDAIFVHVDGRFAYLNQATARLLKAPSPDALAGRSIREFIHPDFHGIVDGRLDRLMREKRPVPLLEERYLRMDGIAVAVETSAVPIRYGDADGALVFVRDITERIERETAHDILERQLAQARKMESVGRLAGGVAHDFNNMLSVITGYSELALTRLHPGDALRNDLEEILSAAGRSADIIRQLLAFARRQTAAPVVLNLNDAVEGMLRMLRRLIGEAVELSWSPRTGLWPVRIDPAQVDQIITNLCVNARDAVTDVGKIAIETHNIVVDGSGDGDHPATLEPGEYVMITVTDNGIGMAPETLEKVFEPFFTTKASGRGTGLGMATVYGIVRQNHGFIHVDSELEKGTRVRIFLPRHHADAGPASGDALPEKAPNGRGETVLLVEDEPAILKMGKQLVEGLGYTVLPATGPEEAVTLAAAHPGRIHLLVTDVVMPGMSGRDLAQRLQSTHPDIQVLFVSGYTADIIAHHGVLDDGVTFLQKPFSRKTLAEKLRQLRLREKNDKRRLKAED